MSVKDYFEDLAARHKKLLHREEEPHFACSMDDAATLMAFRLCYPAVFLDEGDFTIGGETGHKLLRSECRLAFVTHVMDSGNWAEILDAFAITKVIMKDFLTCIEIDRSAGNRIARSIQMVGAEGHRVELEGSGLYGWMLFFTVEKKLTLCFPADVESFNPPAC